MDGNLTIGTFTAIEPRAVRPSVACLAVASAFSSGIVFCAIPQIAVPFLWLQRPLVKSGNRAEALPDATDASLSGPGTLQEAAS